MQLPRFEYLRPETLGEGLSALRKYGNEAVVLAGGTDLLINMKFRLMTPKVVISLGALPELCEVAEQSDGSLCIGSACTLTDLAAHPLVAARYPALRDGIHEVGSRHVRNTATLGGNLCLDTRCWYVNQTETWRASREGCLKTGTDRCHAIKSATRCHAISSSDTHRC